VPSYREREPRCGNLKGVCDGGVRGGPVIVKRDLITLSTEVLVQGIACSTLEG